MVFSSFDDLMRMGGHGPYVWASYAVTVIALVALAVGPLVARHRLLREIAGRARRDAARAKTATPEPTAEE